MIHKFQNLNLQRWNKKVRKTCTVFKITDILLPANEFLVPNEAVGNDQKTWKNFARKLYTHEQVLALPQVPTLALPTLCPAL